MQADLKLLTGAKHKDQRGLLQYFNDFDLTTVKRLYYITHFNKEVIRAWQGHKIEERWFCCVQGSFDMRIAKIDNWENPSESLEVKKYHLKDTLPQVLHVPGGYINGFRATQNNSKLMVMSNYLIHELKDDEVRFEAQKWTIWDN